MVHNALVAVKCTLMLYTIHLLNEIYLDELFFGKSITHREYLFYTKIQWNFWVACVNTNKKGLHHSFLCNKIDKLKIKVKYFEVNFSIWWMYFELFFFLMIN